MSFCWSNTDQLLNYGWPSSPNPEGTTNRPPHCALRDRPAANDAGFGDWLEVQLRRLLDVADAIRFAHSRGIVHRDLKPENVMLGDFGEVMVVDWGVAVSTDEAHRGKLPMASDSRHIAGTPAYMSPEQAAADARALGPRTDVYLLGAILHELLTGKAPHDHLNVHTALFSAYQSDPPEFPPTVSAPLADICMKALARAPEARYHNVDDMRAALREYLKNRASIEITERALRDAEKLADTPEADALDGASMVDPHGVHKLFTGCRFGFQQALDIWPGNARARDGLQGVLELMIGRSLRAGLHTQAALLVEELPLPNPDLRQKVTLARSTARREQEGLRKLGHLGQRHDLRIGRRMRLWVSLGLTVIWTGATLAEHVALDSGALSNASHFAIAAAMLVAVIVYGVVRHEHIRRAGINQRLLHVVALCCVAITALRLYGWLHDVSPALQQADELLVFFLASGSMAALTKRRLIIASAMYALASAFVAVWPSMGLAIAGLAHSIALGASMFLLDLGVGKPSIKST